MSSWMKTGENVADFAMVVGIKLGVTLLVLGAFVTALTGTASATVTNIINALGNAVSALIYPIFIVSFVVIILVLINSINKGAGGRKGRHD